MATPPPARPLTIYLSLTSSPSAPRAQLTLHSPSDNGINTTVTASELRRKASEITSVPLETLKLIFRGRVIPEKDGGDVVEEYKLEDGCVVHVMGKPSAVASTTVSSSHAAAAERSTTSTYAGATVTLPTANAAANNLNNDGSTSSATTVGRIQAAISKLRTSNDPGTYREGLSTAHKLLGNIITNVSFF